jgi:hypothetical protein
MFFYMWNWNIPVGKATDNDIDDRGSIPVRDKRVLSTPHCPESLLDPPSLIIDEYRSLFPRR